MHLYRCKRGQLIHNKYVLNKRKMNPLIVKYEKRKGRIFSDCCLKKEIDVLKKEIPRKKKKFVLDTRSTLGHPGGSVG